MLTRYMLRTIGSSPLRSRLITSTSLLALNNSRSLMRSIPVRSYSSKETDKKKNDQPQSILTEDILAKAGFEDIDPKNHQAKEGEQENPTEEESNDGSQGEKTTRRSRRRAQTSKDIKRERAANLFYLFSFAGAIVGVGYLSRDWDNEKEQKSLEAENIDNGYTPQLMYERLTKRLSSLFTFFSEPAFEQLLPPPAPEAYRRPLTLVLTLDDLLVHSSWDTKHGWRTAKRPGLDYFLGYLSQYYEIVIFGSNYQVYSDKTVNKLDPYHAFISFALFKEACRYKDGKNIKDLSLLNRDLGKTIMIEVDETCASLQPENSIVLKPWEGKSDDDLIKLIPFLEYLATQPVKDVRPILSSFKDKSNIIEEFTERERLLRERWAKDNQHLLNQTGKPNAGNFLAQLFGVPSFNKEPKMPLDIIREHGQFQYQQMLKHLNENIQKFLEDDKKFTEQFGKTSINKLLTEERPSPEKIAEMQAEFKKKQEEEEAAAARSAATKA
ncbi:mitochondrial inner membrane protein required for protein import [Scheffersomyces coipomensis]|uniref:mitochondrial inner membrane protein required for protein import n=1 Tax=Scheffersomyces coipomensis TaxID=1788519 RepID=UPI00315C5E68